MSRHWSDEELIDHLYGIGRGDQHLEQCEECRARWLRVRERRDMILRQSPEIPEELMVAQRAALQHRVAGGGHGWSLPLTPALAALAVVVLALVLSRPAPAPEPTLASTDGEFFTEIYAMVESPEPLAAEPINGLFED